MSDASDATGIGNQPEREANMLSYIYFFFFVLVGSFFILNLIVGVIIESFQKLRKQVRASHYTKLSFLNAVLFPE